MRLSACQFLLGLFVVEQAWVGWKLGFMGCPHGHPLALALAVALVWRVHGVPAGLRNVGVWLLQMLVFAIGDAQQVLEEELVLVLHFYLSELLMLLQFLSVVRTQLGDRRGRVMGV